MCPIEKKLCFYTVQSIFNISENNFKLLKINETWDIPKYGQFSSMRGLVVSVV